MSDLSKKPDNLDADGRRDTTRGRQMTPGRRMAYAIGGPLLGGLARLLWWSCRIVTVIGAEHVEAALKDGRACVPCYWHRDIFVCLMTLKGWIARGYKAAIIISPSVDGEVPARIARAWGAEVVRGSAKRTGALAMRDLHEVMKRGVSIVTAADGPVGPAYYFKSGVIMTSRIGKAPMLPLGCAASRAWRFNTWDHFMLPKPFARIVVAIGEPVDVPARADAETLDRLRETMEIAVNSLSEESKKRLDG